MRRGTLVLTALLCCCTDPPEETKPPSVAVLPMTNMSPDPLESDYLADGIAQAVTARLTQAGLRVIPWDTARRYHESEQPADAIARELNVDAALVGTFQLSDEKILLNLSLVDAVTGFQSWADILVEPYDNVFQLQLEVARSVATSLKQTLTGEEEKALASTESGNVEAYDLYLQGAHLLMEETEEATSVALEYFLRACDLDPDLADAQVGVGAAYTARLSNGWGGVENLERARSRYEAALRSNLSSLRARRGLIVLDFLRGKSESCLSRGREAARLGAPNDVEVLLARAEAYQLCGLPDRSVPLLERALELDPQSQAARWRLALGFTWSGNHREAVEAGEAYLARFGDDPEVHLWLGLSQQILGDVDSAWHHYQKAIEWRDALRAFYYAGLLFDRAGEPERARELWERGAQRILSAVEDDRDQVKLWILLASFYGFLHRDEFLQAEARALSYGLNAFELRYLAIVHAWRGDEARAVALLKDALRRGRLDSAWRVTAEAASVDWTTPAFASFVEEHQELEERLRRDY